MTANLTDIRLRLTRVAGTLAKLDGIEKAHAARFTKLSSEVAEAKGRQSLGPEIKRAFNSLQARQHERSVGTYERALSKLLNDVLPDEGQIRLVPSYKDSTTWLDVLLQKETYLEDIFEGNGGAVDNVVATGLRVTGLVRTRNRRYLNLDEPDCWIKDPEKNAALLRVIAQVARNAKIQTPIISHFNDPAVFAGAMNVVKFVRKKDGTPDVEVVQPLVSQWTDDTTPGVRAIELFNICSHVHTVVPLFPEATVYMGPHNLGKSTALSRAMRAMAYGAFDDSLIRHGCTEARIVVHLENQMRLEAVRSSKRSPALVYRLYQGNSDTPLEEGRPPSRGTVPEFVEKTLRITKVDDFDIQLRHQKLPVFLLNETASRRAQILSIGRESGHLRVLMKDYEKLVDSDNATVKKGEIELRDITADLESLKALPALSNQLTTLVDTAEKLSANSQRLDVIKSLMTRIEESTARLNVAQAQVAVFSKLPELPQLVDTDTIARLISEISRRETLLRDAKLPALPELPTLVDTDNILRLANAIESRSKLLTEAKIPTLPELPTLVDTATIAEFGKRITASQERIRVLSAVPALPPLPELKDLAQLERTIAALTAAETRVKSAEADAKSAAEGFVREDAAFEALKEEMGVCPLCEQTHFDHEHSHAAHA